MLQYYLWIFHLARLPFGRHSSNLDAYMTRIEGEMVQKGRSLKKEIFFISSETFIVACTFQNIKFVYLTTLLSKALITSHQTVGRMMADTVKTCGRK
jgi:hypothetical protein